MRLSLALSFVYTDFTSFWHHAVAIVATNMLCDLDFFVEDHPSVFALRKLV